MLIKTLSRVALLLAFAALAGCATSRSEISLATPQANSPSSTAAASGCTAIIRTVTDERHFELDPDEPSTPSLGFEGADKATAAVKARAIGRKRNTFGKAMGDVLLENGQTVAGVVRQNTAAALEQAGYRVEDAGTDDPAALVIDIHIKKFWAWFEPGFWAIKLHTNIATDLDLSGSAKPVTVSVHEAESRQIATDSAWMDIIDKALSAYRGQVTQKAKAFP